MSEAVATMTTKGQITVPGRVREKLRLRAGSKLVFEELSNGDFILRKKTGDIRALRGILKAPPGFAPTLEDFDRAISEEVRERDARTR